MEQYHDSDIITVEYSYIIDRNDIKNWIVFCIKGEKIALPLHAVELNEQSRQFTCSHRIAKEKKINIKALIL